MSFIGKWLLSPQRCLTRFAKLHVEEVMAESELRIENLSIYHARLASL